MSIFVVLVWLALLGAAIPYVRAARHPEAKPLAAYLIFLTVFSVAAYVVFGAIMLGVLWAGRPDILAHPVAAILALLVIFAPAFWLARMVIRAPPRRAPRI